MFNMSWLNISGTYLVKRIQNNLQKLEVIICDHCTGTQNNSFGIYLFKSMFSIKEATNRILTCWNSQESILITTTGSEGINYTDDLSVMWMSGPDVVTEKAGGKTNKQENTARIVMHPHAKMKLPTCWQRVNSDPKAIWRSALTHLHCWTLAGCGCCWFF